MGIPGALACSVLALATCFPGVFHAVPLTCPVITPIVGLTLRSTERKALARFLQTWDLLILIW